MLREKGVFARTFMDFAGELRGVVIQPGDLGYDEARNIWHDAPDRRPAVIVRVADAADVQCALAIARAEGLPIMVRSDGHQPAGQTGVDGGLIFDLFSLKGVAVDPVARIVRVEAGLRLAELDAATQAFGLAVPAGQGFDGGTGWLMRKHGSVSDNLLAVSSSPPTARCAVPARPRNRTSSGVCATAATTSAS